MRRIIIGIDDKGKISTDFDGFAGPSCFEEARKLASRLKELGVDINVQNLQPKQDSKAQNTQNHLVKEGE